jgi:Fe-S-cluster containining protein
MIKEEVLKICQECGAKCCKLGGADFSEKEMEIVLENGEENLFVKNGENCFEIKTDNLRCPYLKDDESCKIHGLRPQECQSWPIYPEFDGKKVVYHLVDCKLTSKLTKKEINELLKIAKEIPKEVLEGIHHDSKLPKSLIKEIDNSFNKFKMEEIKLR